ncbi:MAG: EamA family transporter [Hyphomicrobiales bacterium]|nr:MAG: EamA family transporter [Hyphomicrobiales bacterium]
MTNSQMRGHIAMLTFSILVAGSFIFGVRVANLAEPAAINSARFIIAALLIAVYLWFNPTIKMVDFAPLKIAPWRYLVLATVFSAYFIFMFEGLKTAAAVSSSVIFTLMPIMTAFFGYIILRQVITKRMALALLIGAIGAIWVVFRADISNLVAFNIGRGEMIYLFGCIFHAMFIPLSRKYNCGEKPIVSTLTILVVGGVIMAIFGYEDLLAVDWLNMPLMFWIGLLYLGIFSSAVTFFLIQYAALALPSGKVMAYNFLTPVWVILVEVSMGQGWPPLLISAGIVMAIIALIMLLKDEQKIPV